MAMSYEEFQVYAENMLKISKIINDGWSGQRCPHNKTMFLVKTQRDIRSDFKPSTLVSGAWAVPVKYSAEGSTKKSKTMVTRHSLTCISFSENDREKSSVETLSVTPERQIMVGNPTCSYSDKKLHNICKVNILLTNKEEREKFSVFKSVGDQTEMNSTEKFPLELEREICELSKYTITCSDHASLPNLESSDVKMNAEDDLATYHVPDDNSSLTWEYHVVYSASYCVPVLYFNVWTANGGLLNLDQVWNILQLNVDDKWTTITQVEHPYLRKPYFQLHPCKTQNLINLITKEFTHSLGCVEISRSGSNTFCPHKNKLISWLSCVACYVQLSIPIDYGKSMI